MFNRIGWLKHQRSNKCPSCSGNTTFRRSLVKSTYYCPVCKNVWKYKCIGFQHKNPKPIWFYENRELNKNLIKIR